MVQSFQRFELPEVFILDVFFRAARNRHAGFRFAFRVKRVDELQVIENYIERGSSHSFRAVYGDVDLAAPLTRI